LADASVQENLEKICQTDDLVELFEMLDVDGSGSVEIDEFCEELANLGSVDQPFINVRLMKQLEFIRRENRRFREQSYEKFFKLESALSEVATKLTYRQHEYVDAQHTTTRQYIDDRYSKLQSRLNGFADDIGEIKKTIGSLGEAAGLHTSGSGCRSRQQIHALGSRRECARSDEDFDESLPPSFVEEAASNDRGSEAPTAAAA